MFCADCGKELKPGKKFCIYCGEPIPEEIQKFMVADMRLAGSKEVEKKPADPKQEPAAQMPECSGNMRESHGENKTEMQHQSDEITESANADIIQEDDDPDKTVLIVDERGEETLILSESENNTKTDDVDRISDPDIPAAGPDTAEEEDDGETELVEMDINRSDMEIADKAEGNASGSEQTAQTKPKQDKELKYLNNTINDPGIGGTVNVPREKKSGGTSLIIKVLLTILIILVLVAAGLAAYFYVDSIKMREQFAYVEENSVSAVNIYDSSECGGIV